MPAAKKTVTRKTKRAKALPAPKRREVIIGVDPGFSGALVALDYLTGEVLDILDMPVRTASGSRAEKRIDPFSLLAWLKNFPAARVAMEEVAARPGNGVRATWSFGRGVGVVETVIALAGLPLSWVTPPTWKRHHRILNTDKNASRAKAQDLLPNSAMSFARVRDDGRAEAALIALWGRQNYESRA